MFKEHKKKSLWLLIIGSLIVISACSCARKVVEPPFNESFHELVQSALDDPSTNSTSMYYSVLSTSKIFNSMDSHCYPGLLFTLDDNALKTYLSSVGITFDEFKTHPKKDEFFAAHFIPEFVHIEETTLEYIAIGGNTISLKGIQKSNEGYNLVANDKNYIMVNVSTFSASSNSTSLDNTCAKARKEDPTFTHQLFRVGNIDRPIMEIDW